MFRLEHKHEAKGEDGEPGFVEAVEVQARTEGGTARQDGGKAGQLRRVVVLKMTGPW
jgi:hypothetical protein